MRKKKIKGYMLLILAISLFANQQIYGCFAVIAGKDASCDVSVIFGHLEQNGGLRNMSYFYVPRMYHDPGSFVEQRRGGKWPQEPLTYACLWGNSTGAEADLHDTENVIASRGLVEYAISRGWYDPAEGRPFSFREVHGAPAPAGSF